MATTSATDILFLSGVRTPFGAFNGSLRNLTATDLGEIAGRAAVAKGHIPASAIAHTIFGNVLQTSKDAAYLARHVGLRVGLPQASGALTVNRLCGSGLEAFACAAQLLQLGHAEAVLAGGTESMSQAPHVIRGARAGIALGKSELEDTLTSVLYDAQINMPMGMTAEKLAREYQISQEEVDEFSVSSQRRYQAAHEAGRFKQELVPVTLPARRGEPSVFERDEHPRPTSTVEGFKKLPKVFDKDGVIHPGAASGINDGAAAAVMATRAFATKHGAQPIGRLVAWDAVGCDPSVMGIGPVPAIQRVLERAGLTLAKIDLFEVNEAFAPQYLAVEKALGLPRDRTNVDGGAIAIGHPLGASGARIGIHLLHELKRRGAKLGIASACIGGGQGIAALVEVE